MWTVGHDESNMRFRDSENALAAPPPHDPYLNFSVNIIENGVQNDLLFFMVFVIYERQLDFSLT